MIQRSIPGTSRYIATLNTFTAAFNAPVVGKYSFNVAGNINQTVYGLQPNVVYYIDNLSISGNIDNQIFLNAIETPPLLTLTRKIGKEIIYVKPIPAAIFADSKEANVFVLSDKGGDEIQISLSGVLKQTADLVGVASVEMYVAAAIYAIDDISFTKKFREGNLR